MDAPLSHPAPQYRIDPANPGDLLAWAELLDVEADVLRDAVELVGDDAEAVELALKGQVKVCAH